MIFSTLDHLINPSNCTTPEFTLKVLRLLKPTFGPISHYLSKTSSSSMVFPDNTEKTNFNVTLQIFRLLRSTVSQICKVDQEHNLDVTDLVKTILDHGLVKSISKVASDCRYYLYLNEIISELIHTVNGLCAIIPKERVVKPFVEHLMGMMTYHERNYDNESIFLPTSTFFLIVTAYSFESLKEAYEGNDLDRVIPIPEITAFWMRHVINPSGVTTQSFDQLETVPYFLRATWMLEPLANCRKFLPLTTAISSDYKSAVLGAVAYYFNNSESFPLVMLREVAEFVGFIASDADLGLLKNYDMFISSCRKVTCEFPDKAIISNINKCIDNDDLD